jgi:hypothetical protein
VRHDWARNLSLRLDAENVAEREAIERFNRAQEEEARRARLREDVVHAAMIIAAAAGLLALARFGGM